VRLFLFIINESWLKKAKELSENYLRHLLSADSLPAIVTLPEDFNGKLHFASPDLY
jgi:hypothetical protein